MESLVGTSKKILIICEGTLEVKLFNLLTTIYPLSLNYSFYKYNTNIHILGNSLKYYFDEEAFEISNIDIIQILKEFRYAEVLDFKFTDILLIFDFDPQDARYNDQFLVKLLEYFSDSSNQGQLFINYPMVESVIDFHNLPDYHFNHRRVSRNELVRNQYKIKVKKSSIIGDINNIDITNFKMILFHTFSKIKFLTSANYPDYLKLLNLEIKLINDTDYIDVINTSILFLYEYNQTEFKKFIDCSSL